MMIYLLMMLLLATTNAAQADPRLIYHSSECVTPIPTPNTSRPSVDSKDSPPSEEVPTMALYSKTSEDWRKPNVTPLDALAGKVSAASKEGSGAQRKSGSLTTVPEDPWVPKYKVGDKVYPRYSWLYGLQGTVRSVPDSKDKRKMYIIDFVNRLEIKDRQFYLIDYEFNAVFTADGTGKDFHTDENHLNSVNEYSNPVTLPATPDSGFPERWHEKSPVWTTCKEVILMHPSGKYGVKGKVLCCDKGKDSWYIIRFINAIDVGGKTLLLSEKTPYAKCNLREDSKLLQSAEAVLDPSGLQCKLVVAEEHWAYVSYDSESS